MCRHPPCPHPHLLSELFLVNCVGEREMLLNSIEAPSLLIHKSDRKLLGHSFQKGQDHCNGLCRFAGSCGCAGTGTLSLFEL